MKQLILLTLFVLSAATFKCQKAELDESRIPGPAKATFVKENPDTKAIWKTEGGNYKAQYVDASNTGHARLYTRDGNLLWRDDEMTGYPVAIKNYYTITYPGEEFVVWSRIDDNGETMYYLYKNADMIWFDKNGRCIKPKKKDNTIQMK